VETFAGGRARAGRIPGYERLEGRDLLATALSGGFLSPSGDVVSKAQAVIARKAAAEFSRYQGDLQRAEQGSRVTPAAFANLTADGNSLAEAIETAPLTAQASTQDLFALQDVLDQAFLDASDKSSQWDQVSQQLGVSLYGVIFTTNLPSEALTDM